MSQLQSATADLRRWPDVDVSVRSTLPPGLSVRLPKLLGRANGARVSTNPEFLRQGSAVHDYEHPSRIIFGRFAETTDAHLAVVERVYAAIEAPRLRVDVAAAELIKNVANGFLALKLSFVNEVAALSEEYGVEVTEVLDGIGLDPRIGSVYMRPGLGFGGSCLPKELQVLAAAGRRRGLSMHVARAISQVNVEQQDRFVRQILAEIPRDESRVGLLGLSFKADTDDLRGSPALHVARRLLEEGVVVTAHDPAVRPDRAVAAAPGCRSRAARRSSRAPMPSPLPPSGRNSASSTLPRWRPACGAGCSSTAAASSSQERPSPRGSRIVGSAAGPAAGSRGGRRSAPELGSGAPRRSVEASRGDPVEYRGEPLTRGSGARNATRDPPFARADARPGAAPRRRRTRPASDRRRYPSRARPGCFAPHPSARRRRPVGRDRSHRRASPRNATCSRPGSSAISASAPSASASMRSAVAFGCWPNRSTTGASVASASPAAASAAGLSQPMSCTRSRSPRSGRLRRSRWRPSTRRRASAAPCRLPCMPTARSRPGRTWRCCRAAATSSRS